MKIVILMIVAMLQCSCSSVLVKSNAVSGEILARSAQWNTAFAQRDVSMLMELFSKDAQFASAGGKWQGQDAGTRGFANLLLKRPDLRWLIHPKDTVVNTAWGVAYETGEWSEWWTEPDGRAKITGTYFLMWKKIKSEPWLIHAAIFTPLACTGESDYCTPHGKS